MNLARSVFRESAMFLTAPRRATHTYVIGQPGTGKSRALEAWAMQDIAAGRGVAVVDPHGDLFRNLVFRVAARPEIAERVVILDPCDRNWVVSFNPLEAVAGVSQERLALFLTDVVVKIWKLDAATAPRLVWLLTNTFLALADLQMTLLDLPRFLLDSAFRESLLPRLKREAARTYFAFEFPHTESGVHQWVTPALNKMASLIFDPDVRLMLAGRSTLNFRDVLKRQLVLLVHLPKGILGEGVSALLGAFIVAHLQKAALARANTWTRAPYYLYLDEFQNYTTDNIQDILSESRKYGLSLTLAHQYLDQLTPELRSGVLNTAGTLACFRVGYHDAYLLAKEVFPSSAFLGDTHLRARRFLRWPLVTLTERYEPLGWDGLAHELTRLPARQFWARQRGSYAPVLLRTLNVPDPALNEELLTQVGELRHRSGSLFGKSKPDVKREWAPNLQATKQPDSHEIPLWGK